MLFNFNLYFCIILIFRIKVVFYKREGELKIEIIWFGKVFYNVIDKFFKDGYFFIIRDCYMKVF